GKTIYDSYKSSLKVKDDVAQASKDAIAGAANDDLKLQKILDYVRSKIKNSNSDTSGLSDDERAKLKENKSPSDTLKRGIGTGKDISLLFAAMAAAAGYETRVVRIGDRSQSFFSPKMAIPYFLSSYDVAVKVGNEWRVIDPGSSYVPLGMLLWQEEGEEALVPVVLVRR